MKEIYLDHAATSPMSGSARDEYLRVSALPGNPSALHAAGVAVRKEIEAARKTVANAFGAQPDEIIFNSGGSEGNNQAINGFAALRARRAKRIIVGEGEHPSVENTANALSKYGFEVIKIPTKGGKIDVSALDAALAEPTAFVCFMLANNETGALYDIAAVRDALNRAGSDALFHCDAVQAFLKTPDVKLIKKYCDSASVSAHKVGGPKGVGAMYVKKGLKLPPLINGGGQERGYRSGTENAAGIAAFAAAVRDHDDTGPERLKALRGAFVDSLIGSDCGAVVREPERRVDSIVSISVPGVRSEVMLNALSAQGVYVSAGSACAAGRGGTSRVLAAYGVAGAELESALRISFGAENTTEECVYAAEVIAETAKRLRR